MFTIVPGENVDAQHINLKLGPGLLNVMSNGPSGSANYIIATRAGNLNHSANGAKWWIESNSRRVREPFVWCLGNPSDDWIVYSSNAGVCHRCHLSTTG